MCYDEPWKWSDFDDIRFDHWSLSYFGIFMPPPIIVGGEYYAFASSVYTSVRPSVVVKHLFRVRVRWYLGPQWQSHMKLGTNFHHVTTWALMKRVSRSQVKGQGHRQDNGTFAAKGCPSTYGHPSVVYAAEAERSTVWRRWWHVRIKMAYKLKSNRQILVQLYVVNWQCTLVCLFCNKSNKSVHFVINFDLENQNWRQRARFVFPRSDKRRPCNS